MITPALLARIQPNRVQAVPLLIIELLRDHHQTSAYAVLVILIMAIQPAQNAIWLAKPAHLILLIIAYHVTMDQIVC